MRLLLIGCGITFLGIISSAVAQEDKKLLTELKAGIFAFGEPIEAGTFDNSIIHRKLITESEEGSDIQRYQYDVMENDRLALQILGGYDHRANTPVEIIIETMVFSPKYKTLEDISVGSSLSKTLKTYPRSKIFYSYVCDCIWLENGAYGIQFRIDKQDYRQNLASGSDAILLDANDFKADAKISSIRIFGERFDGDIEESDFLGRYVSKEGYVAHVFQKNENTFLRWKTGSDIYLDNTYRMQLNNNKLISAPSLEANIELEINDIQEKQLVIRVDDNPKFDPIKLELSPSLDTSDNAQNTLNAKELSLNKKIKKIRSVYQHVNTNQQSYEVKTHKLHESSEGGEKIFYIENNQFRKIVENHFGEMGKRNTEYYFDENGALSFIFDVMTHYNVPIYIDEPEPGIEEVFDPKKSKTKENRYYFYAGKMIRWIDSDGNKVPRTDPNFQEKSDSWLKTMEKHQ